MRIVSQMQCFVLFLWAVCKPKMMQSNIKSSWLSWNRWLSTRSVLLVFSSSLGKPLFGRPIGLSIGCSLHLELTSIYLLFVLVNVLMQANAEAVLCECICSGKSPWLHRQEHWRGAGGTQFLLSWWSKYFFAGGPCCVQGKGLRGGQRGQQVFYAFAIGFWPQSPRKIFLWTWLWVNLVLKSSHRDWLQNKRIDSKVRKDKGQLRSAGDPVQAGEDQEIISIFTVSSAYWLNIKPEKKYWFGILSSLSRDVSVRWRSW